MHENQKKSKPADHMEINSNTSRSSTKKTIQREKLISKEVSNEPFIPKKSSNRCLLIVITIIIIGVMIANAIGCISDAINQVPCDLHKFLD